MMANGFIIFLLTRSIHESSELGLALTVNYVGAGLDPARCQGDRKDRPYKKRAVS